jgi:hypothetical protein
MVGLSYPDSSLACLATLDWDSPPEPPIGQITNHCRQDARLARSPISAANKRSTLYVSKSCHRHTRAGGGEGSLLPQVGICFEFGEYS